jgi:hypothetical protein
VDGINPGSIVVVNCGNPREKMWGCVIRLDMSGVVIRGLDLESVEDWLRQESFGGDGALVPSTFFLPMHRVLRIDLDESAGPVESFADRFRSMSGRDVHDVLDCRAGKDE